MTEKISLVATNNIVQAILMVRRKRVMLGNDLARLFGVSTRRLNEQVRRNIDRFPGDFMFQLTQEEKNKVVANCDHLSNLKFTQSLPFAFTEHGIIMLANVLNSPEAVKASIQVVRAFIKLRAMLASHEDLARKVDALEKKYDAQFKTVFDAIRQLMVPAEPKKKKNRIGFHWQIGEKPAGKKTPARKKPASNRKAPEDPCR
ncbi:MAG: ORF6N domain-containing protein [Thermoleophilia bacterium]|nr:ORF6N domain-containing protein [Thermoleophilia bacterium]